MTGLVLIRHAETALAGTFCGHSDPWLHARGRQQVQSLVERLSSEHFDIVYSSDLRRAMETAVPLAESMGAPCISTPALREVNFGAWEGLAWAEIEASDPQLAQRWIDAFPSVAAPHGEPYEFFEARVWSELNRLLQLASSRRISAVTHAGVMRVALQRLMGCTQPEAWGRPLPYCGTLELETRQTPELVAP